MVLVRGKREVKLNKGLVEKLEKRAGDNGFKSVDSYIEEILKKALKSFEKNEEKDGYSDDDEKKVKERLRALGYL